jgi:NAD-dependent DNA ligase
MVDKLKRFSQLSWKILEHKCRYYYFDAPIIADHEYDALEREYDQLAEDLGLEPTAANMVGFKLDRPACQAVLFKLQKEEV